MVMLVVSASYSVWHSSEMLKMSDVVLANVEALANGEIGTGGYTKSTGNCSGPVYYKKWVSCKSGGTEECSPSDC